MTVEAIINVISSLGLPIGIIIFFGWLVVKYLPKGIEAYTKAKAVEQEQFKERQKSYAEQSERIVQIAADSTSATAQATMMLEKNVAVIEEVKKALECNSIGNKEVLGALTAMGKMFNAMNGRFDEISGNTKLILENARKVNK
jgi:hypothetical protein